MPESIPQYRVPVVCPECNGEGVDVARHALGGHELSVCGMCDGEGSVPVELDALLAEVEHRLKMLEKGGSGEKADASSGV